MGNLMGRGVTTARLKVTERYNLEIWTKKGQKSRFKDMIRLIKKPTCFLIFQNSFEPAEYHSVPDHIHLRPKAVILGTPPVK
jgi:hypothetical protein